MKKLFLLIPALVISMMMSATNIRVTTESYSSDVIRKALYYATVDTIIVADGTYEESASNYLALDKNIVLVAEGDNAIIQTLVPFTISGGVKATIKGFKIDATYMTGYSHLIYSADASDNNLLYIDGCDIYGYTAGKAIIASRGSNKLDSLIINDCKFYNHTTRSCVFLENTENKGLIVTNSTFYNIATGTESFSAGILDDRSTTAKVRVDHCTFYNVIAQNTNYAAVGKIKSSDAIVSNSIFMLPSNQDGIRAIRDVATANNCLTYNYTYDSNWGIHSSVVKNNCIQLKDPAFINAASGDFHITDASPAHLVGSDNKSLGAKCWWPAAPETDFATAYNLVGSKAGLVGNIRLNANSNIEYYDNSVAGTAVWEVKATRACAIQAVIDMETGSASGSIFQIKVYKENGEEVGTFDASYKEDDEDINMSGTVYLPKAGVYTFKLFNNKDWSSAKVEKIILSYVGGAVQAMPGTTNINEAWFSAEGTRAAGKIDFPDGYIQDGWVKWNVHFANAGNYNVTLNVNSNNCKNYTVALVDANDANVVTPLTLNDCSTKGTPVALAMGAMEVPAGNYILKVTNATQNSDAELISVQFAYTGGGIIDIPGSIALNEAILSERAFVDGDGLHFVDADHLWLMSEGYAKWNIHVAADGMYKFTANCNTVGESYSNLTIKVLKGGEEKYSHTPQYTYTGEKTINSPEWFLEAGNYELKLSNPKIHSNGYLVSLSAAAVEGILIVDEMATDMAYINELNGQSRKPLLKRTFKGGMYNTVCFPFNNVTDAELVNLFGEGYELLELSSATLNGTELNLIFANVDLSADTYGRPYLIKPTQDVENPLFNSHTIYKSTSHLTKECDAANFIGSFIAGEVPAGDQNLFLGPNDLLYFSQNATPIKGMRAYFHVKVPGAANNVKAARIVKGTQVITEINLVGADSKAIKTIENGQLIITIDGVRYNVMGTKIQ